MSEMDSQTFKAGDLTGRICEKWDVECIRQLAGTLRKLIDADGVEVMSSGRNKVVCIGASRGEWSGRLAVKVFGRRSIFKDMFDSKTGSRAQRTFETAVTLRERGVGTPEPVFYLERWHGRRLKESYYASVLVEDAVSFKDELIHLFNEDPECSRFMDLMQSVAEGIAGMHDAGVLHRDLGNQNILLRRSGKSWVDVQFMDLNRSRISEALSLQQRARDISRIYLPSDLLRIFVEMYFRGAVPPGAFRRMESLQRRLFALHTATRGVRHPIKALFRSSRREQSSACYPMERDMWIWDSRSAQPISVMRRKQRRKWYPWGHHIQVVKSSFGVLSEVRKAYREILSGAYVERIDMRGRLGIALGLDSGNDERELEYLEEMGKVPVLIRFHAHRPQSWDQRIAYVRNLAAEGRDVSIALLQDKESVTDPAKWQRMVSTVAKGVKGAIRHVEIGHAINRVKWGLWDIRDYAQLVQPTSEAFDGADIRLSGPAVIDFEYQYIPAALDALPEGFTFDALSHHLYVDRRGAPENRQSGYSTLEKAALLKAIARTHPATEERVIVSEVNWPIKGTGVWSPVNSPYVSPGERKNDPSVSEEDYAAYMIRYILTCICSGMVDQLFWWRLVARGFGLVDDTEADSWRKRPAFLMLKQFIKMMDGATYVDRRRLGEAGIRMTFETSGGSVFAVCFTEGRRIKTGEPFECVRVLDAYGKDVESGGPLELSGNPVYCRRAEL